MTTEHPITPPPELIAKWAASMCGYHEAARWGADTALEACSSCGAGDMLRAARRPKPPSLKAGAIEVLDELDGLFELPAGHYNTILRALEKLDDSL